MSLNCRPGDLAITVNTQLPDNEGTIVRVVHRHVNSAGWDWGDVPAWWCESDELLHWKRGEMRFSGHEAAIPDRVLRPIRDKGDDDELHLSEELDMQDSHNHATAEHH